MKFIIHILPCILLLSSCAGEKLMHNDVHRLDISFADTRTRSIWEDKSDAEDKVCYIWENNTNMLTAIKHSDRYVPFYESLASAAQYHSMTAFETVDAARSKIRLQTLLGVKYDVADGEYIYPVSVGDNMYCCHPLNGNTVVNSNADAVSVDMHLPSSFSYSELVNDLTPLADYSYVYTSTTLQSVEDNSVIANASHFNSACAIIRFNVTNNITSDIIITGIKMEAGDGSRIFPDVLRFSDGSVAEQADKSSYYSRLTTDIASVTIPRTQKGIFYNMCFPLDGDFNHTPLKFTIDTNYLTYQMSLNSDVITNHKLEAGKIYTFNFSLEEKEIRLNTIEISRCTTYNVDNEESLNVVLTPDAEWNQSDNYTAQMVFVSLGMTTNIGDKDYDVLWATCNLGAMEPVETGYLYAWGEVERKASSLYSPDGYTGTASSDISGTAHDAVRAYLGEGYWLWSMPTKEMWQDIIKNCSWTWIPVKKVSDGTASEENLDFDASVWEVTKKNDEGKVVGIIYFPVTGYSGLDDNGNYTKVNKARCCFWSSTPASDVDGAKEKSWAFVTTYYIDTSGTGNGNMTAPQMQECERYNGFAIRPVLLKERK